MPCQCNGGSCPHGSLNHDWKPPIKKSVIQGHVISAINQSCSSCNRFDRRSVLSGAEQVRIWTRDSSEERQTGQFGESRCWRRCISSPEGVLPLIHFVINFRCAKEACFLALAILVQQSLSFSTISSISHLSAKYSIKVF